MNISVIIPTFNEEHYISSLLHDLNNQTLKPTEIIVIDSHSSDRTCDEVAKFPHVILKEHEPSVALQRNYGAQISTGGILIFLDADVHIKTDFIEKCIRDFTKKNLDIACPLYVNREKTIILLIFLFFLNGIFFLLQKILPSGGGNCIIVKREIFMNSSQFKPQLFEDMEFIRNTAKKATFGIILQKVFISTRRFKKYGTFRMITTYTLLSLLFTLGLFKIASNIHYSFGNYDEKNK